MANNNKKGFTSTYNTFTINTNGEIIDVVSKGDEQLGAAVKNAFKKLNKKMINSKNSIIPAKNNEDENVNLKFGIPINLNIS